MALLAAGQAVATALLDPLCERVINAALEEYKLVGNAQEEVKNLKFTVSLIKLVLQDAEQKQLKDESVRIWLGSLKQILFDAEDIFDEVATDVALEARKLDVTRSVIGMKRKVLDTISCFGRIDKLSSSHDTTHQIQALMKKLDDISKAKDALGLQVLFGGNSWLENRRPRQLDTDSMLADESCIIGRDDEKKRIVQSLLTPKVGIEQMSMKSNVDVLAIVGMGGVGKTTLAKLVFNDPKVNQHFKLTIWVCVSEDFDLKRITKEIMDAATSPNEGKKLSEISNWDLAKRRFKDVIEEKRFLLVLDDMWEEDPSNWESLYELVNYGGKENKIIITTRSQKVSDIAKAFSIPLKSLSSENLWPILKRYAFDGCDLNKQVLLEFVGRQIVERLKGSPLAAKIVGRLLNSNLDVKYWKSIMKSELWMVQQQANDILSILKLSYDHLSGHLKQHFAYCSLFPKDHYFDKDELVQLWMAQNFIQAEDVGSKCFDDLLYKSFFERSGGNKYVMHDLIHDLAESVSKDDCLRLGDDEPREIYETVRHVLLTSRNFGEEKFKILCNMGNLRTLLFMHKYKFNLNPHLDELFMKLKRLRVLRLCNCRIEELPTSIGALKHLRFVDLSKNLICKLPDSFCHLHNLQVLRLKECRLLGALPSNMSALINLRHLAADPKLVSDIQGLGKLTALQELSISARKVGELADMGMLKRLQISDLDEIGSKEEALRAKLGDKDHLDVVELRWKGDRDDHLVNQRLEEEVLEGLQPGDNISELVVVGYGGVNSPSWMQDHSWVSFSFVTRVVLGSCKNWEALPPLGQLRCLKILIIERMMRVRQIGPHFLGCCSIGAGGGEGGVKMQGFPSLEELIFIDMPEWEEWEAPQQDDGVDDDAGQKQPHQQHHSFFPRLLRLVILKCPKLRELPLLPPTLTELRMDEVGMIHLPKWVRCRGCEGQTEETPSSSCSPSLSHLHIEGCPNLMSLSQGLLQHPLDLLKELRIFNCPELTYLPERAFKQLASLKSLGMGECPKLSRQSSVTEYDVLPSSLEDVNISGCGDMMEPLLSSIQRLTSVRQFKLCVGNMDKVTTRLGKLTSLTSLTVKGCHNLWLRDGLPPSLHSLSLDGDEDAQVDNGALSTCLRGLSSLKFLLIEGCPGITTLPTEDVMCRLTALRWLHVQRCPELTSLGDLKALVSLELLRISECPKLPHLVGAVSSPSSSTVRLKSLYTPSGSPQQITAWLRQCASLTELEIRDCPQLTCFDDDNEGGGDDIGRELGEALLNLAPSLRSLSLRGCVNLRSLPSNLRCLSSLRGLSIFDCPQIQCLPEGGLPQSLEYLSISGCPTLLERCGEVVGPDWPLIADIPKVYIC